VWTISIHDGEYFSSNKFINGAAHHTLHHLYFNYNYGQYFTLWDYIGGSFKMPSERQFSRITKNSPENRQKESTEVDLVKERVEPRKKEE